MNPSCNLFGAQRKAMSFRVGGAVNYYPEFSEGPWGVLGGSWGLLGVPWGVLGGPGGSLGDPWGPLGTLGGSLGGPSGGPSTEPSLILHPKCHQRGQEPSLFTLQPTGKYNPRAKPAPGTTAKYNTGARSPERSCELPGRENQWFRRLASQRGGKRLQKVAP